MRRAQSSRLPLVIGLLLAAGGLVAGGGLWLSHKDRVPQAAVPSPKPAVSPTLSPTIALSTPTPSPEPSPPPPSDENAEAARSAAREAAEATLVRGESLTEASLTGLALDDLRLLRNAIFARHGRAFESPELQAYYAQRPWYQRRADYRDDSLTATDRENLTLIRGSEMTVAATSVRASSIRNPANMYGPAATRDDNLDTVWCEGAPGPGVGEWIEFNFSPQDIRFIDIFPGNGGSRELFEANHHLRRATLLFSDGTRVQGLFSDDPRVQTVALSRPVRASSLRLIIEEVYVGTKNNDTMIAEIHWR